MRGLMKELKKSHLYTALLFVILLGVYQYDINQIYGMVEYPDEFGYWSSAASMIGWDWSQIASRGSYYSFGYSLILFPILKFCEDSVTAYRMAVTVNFSLIIVSFFLLKGIYRRLFTKQVEGEEVLAIGSALLYPAWILYSQMTLVDSLLMFMVILICYLWLRFVEAPGFKWGILLVAAVIYNYTLHMRAVSVLVALVIVMLLWAWKHPAYGKKILLILLVVGIAFLAVDEIKDIVQGNVFAEAGVDKLNNNDYGGQLDKVKYLFSFDGMKQALTIVMGKILYVGLAGAGMVFMAVLWGIEQIVCLFKTKAIASKENDGADMAQETKEKHLSEWFGLFFLLILLGQLAICIVYTIGTKNADWLIYGRYIENFIPMGIFLGVAYVLQKDPGIKVQVGIGILYTIAAFCCVWKMRELTSDYIRGEHSAATTFLIGEGTVKPVHFFVGVWIAGMVLMILARLGLKMYTKDKYKMAIFAVWFLGLAIWGIDAGDIYVYRANDNMAKELIVVNVLEEQLQQGKELYYLEEGNAPWISYVQMQLRENSLNVITIEELKELDAKTSVIVVDGESKHLEYIESAYKRKIPGFNYYAFYNK